MSVQYDRKNARILWTHEDDDGNEIETVIPGRFEVCGACGGSGATTAHVECDGGGFTSSEWAEACADDEDFAADYMSGVHDRPCETCHGLRVEVVPDAEACDPALLHEFEEAASMEASFRAEDRYCARMGY